MPLVTNAIKMRQDQDFRDWLTILTPYVARTVYAEAGTVPEHAARVKMARDTIYSPEAFTNRWINILCSDPEVAALGALADWKTDASQALLISKIAGLWTPLAVDMASA